MFWCFVGGGELLHPGTSKVMGMHRDYRRFLSVRNQWAATVLLLRDQGIQ